MNRYPPGSAPWVAIPMAPPRRGRYELPFDIFEVARDVVVGEGSTLLGPEAVGDEILERLKKTNPKYLPDREFFSPEFQAHLRSSLHHADAARRWSEYLKWEDESSTETSPSSDHSPTGPEILQREPNEATRDDPASEASVNTFYSAQEHASSNDSREESEIHEAASNRSSNASQGIGGLPQVSLASSGSQVTDRNFEALQFTYEILKMKLELLLLQSESRQHRKAKEKRQRKRKMAAQPHLARYDTEEQPEYDIEVPFIQANPGHFSKVEDSEAPSHGISERDELDLLFEE